jgi:lipopolysaccharide biosynthesis glycosyltransferase
MSQFGIYISCHQADLRLTRGCCESIRQFAGDTPICLIFDGDAPLKDLQRQYGCQVLRREDVKNADLRNRSFGGWGYSKFIPFWEGPFDRFLHLDSDTSMLGDVRTVEASTDADIIISPMPNAPHSAETIHSHWFSPDFVTRHFPGFRVEDQPYFCAGVVFGRRGVMDLDEYMRLLELQKQNPGESFQSGDQGILNFLVFHRSASGQLRYATRDFQSYPLYMSRSELDAINANLRRLEDGWKLPPTVLHYIDVKPSVFHDGVFQRYREFRGNAWPAAGWPTVMNRFRVQSWEGAGCSGAVARARVMAEDVEAHWTTFRRRRAKR